MAVIGIDLGTTYSAAAVFVDGKSEIINLEGEPTLPSVVGLQKNGKIAIGKTAKRNQAKFPQNTIIEVKRKMGTDDDVRLGEKLFKPPQISAMILHRIKELAEAELGEEVTGAVISCPAYFKDLARQATREAGEIAGLNILKIINEPTAAAYAYGVRQEDDGKEKLFLVYDLGGGTFDVTVIKMVAGEIEVIGTGGDPQLGGGNFDDEIVNWIKEHIFSKPEYEQYRATLTPEKEAALNLRLKSYAEEGKKALCNSKTGEPYTFQITQVDIFNNKPIVFEETLTMAKFEELILDLMTKSLKEIDVALKVPKEKNYTEDNLTGILLVGGSTRVPLVRNLLKQRFPNTEIYAQKEGINPDEIVAVGAGIVAAEEDPEQAVVSSTLLIDVTGHTLSVAVWDEQKQRTILAPLIPKETPIPCESTHHFQSEGKGQRIVHVRVFQGEGIEIDPTQNTMIGNFVVEIDPIQAPTPLEIGLNLDPNGLLVAHAKNGLNGQEVKCDINYSDSARMSKEELAQKKAQLQNQLNAVIMGAANPLDGAGAAAPSFSSNVAPPLGNWGQQTQTTFGNSPPLSQTPAQPTNQTADPAMLMNPIIRTLYQKAINNFDRVPSDRQGPLMQVVMEVETAARTGDQQKMMSYYAELTKLLDGVS